MYQVQPLLIKYKEILFDQIKLENERNLISQSIPNCNLENNRLFTASKVYYNKKCNTVCDEKFLKFKSQNDTDAFNSNRF